jgi:hypothetical protein
MHHAYTTGNVLKSALIVAEASPHQSRDFEAVRRRDRVEEHQYIESPRSLPDFESLLMDDWQPNARQMRRCDESNGRWRR